MSTRTISSNSIMGFQELNREIYGRQNNWFFSAPRIVSRMNRHAVKALMVVKVGGPIKARGWKDVIAYRLAMTFSWSLALANKLHMDLEEQRRKKFVDTPFMTLQEFQRMIESHIDEHLAIGQTQNLLRDIAKVDEVLEDFFVLHEPSLFGEVGDNLLNVICRICEIATLSGLKLAEEMENQFGNGCPKCRKTPCGCPFIVARTV